LVISGSLGFSSMWRNVYSGELRWSTYLYAITTIDIPGVYSGNYR